MNALKRIEQLRDERNWTNYRLAKEADISDTTLNNLFKRNNNPSIHTLEAICKAFGITLSQFFTENDEIVSLTNEQKALLDNWNKLSRTQKQMTNAYIQGQVDSQIEESK